MWRAALLAFVLCLGLVPGAVLSTPAAIAADVDVDGVDDSTDNCPNVANAGQENLDGDGLGDACDPDIDGDGAGNGGDVWPTDPAEWADLDGDGTGDNADIDDDEDTVADASDNCPTIANAGQEDLDADTTGDACDGDRDGDLWPNHLDDFPDDPSQHADGDDDGVADPLDNCPSVANAGQENIDGDAQGDACDGDRDGDGLSDGADAFPDDVAEQFDTDLDGTGDNADTDDDNDSRLDVTDNCRTVSNFNQSDRDADTVGDVCDADRDGDGYANTSDAFPDDPTRHADTDSDTIHDGADNCPGVSNISQANLDGDLLGDACDPDRDGDGYPDISDAFPADPTRHADADGDGIHDGADNCPTVANATQLNRDGDGQGDACDADRDGDGYANTDDAFPDDPARHSDADGDGVHDGADNCPGVANPTQVNQDGDLLGDACDGDRDGDGWTNVNDLFPDDGSEHADLDGDGDGDNGDNCPTHLNPSQADLDGDSQGDVCDSDDDGDGHADTADAFPRDAVEHVDLDGDGIGDNADTDDDADGRPDTSDLFPRDAAEWADNDGDGNGDNGDSDDDNDGRQDSADLFPHDGQEWADTDDDGVGDNADNCLTVKNAGQADLDGDDQGDPCDLDIDGDGYLNTADTFPRDTAEHGDFDADGVGDNADADDDNDGTPDVFDALPLDRDEQGDVDGDGFGDRGDNCRTIPNRSQADLDDDGLGDPCDGDRDGDGALNANDTFPNDPNERSDGDGDGTGDRSDTCPDVANADQRDADADGLGDVCDPSPADHEARTPAAPAPTAPEITATPGSEPLVGATPDRAAALTGATPADRDGDGIANRLDAFPDDAEERIDSDGDGTGDEADTCPTVANRGQSSTACKPAPGRPSLSRVKASVVRNEVRVAFRLKRSAELQLVVFKKFCAGSRCLRRVMSRTVRAGKGANRLVMADLAGTLPAGVYRLEIRRKGSRQVLKRLAFKVPAAKPR